MNLEGDEEMEKNMLVKSNTNAMIEDMNEAERLCTTLMKSKHYAKLGMDGVFAIVQKAISLGIHPIEALNGGMYYVQGKVEMSAILMAKLIRQQKHSITMDKSSNETLCILHGKRADNGDTWKASFSIADAKRAGLYKDGTPWSKYPDIMCYNRALSKLARQLFPDVIGNCYVEGEISEAPKGDIDPIEAQEAEIVSSPFITQEQADELEMLLGEDDPEFKASVLDFVEKRFGSTAFTSIPIEAYQPIYNKIALHAHAREKAKNEDKQSSIAKNILINSSTNVS